MTCPRCRNGPLDVEAVARLVGIKPNSVSRGLLRQTFPPPDGTVSSRPYWWPATLEAWGKTTKAPAQPVRAKRGRICPVALDT